MLSQKILAYLQFKEAASWAELLQLAGGKKSTLSKVLNKLEEEGMIYREIIPDKPPKAVYKPKNPVRTSAHVVELVGDADVYQAVRQRLYRNFFQIDLLPKRGPLAGFAGVPLLIDLLRTFWTDRKMDEYLDFLTRLFIQSPRLILGRPPASWVELRCAWQLAPAPKYAAPGFELNFESAWQQLYPQISEELKEELQKRGITPEKIFRWLRLFAFPISERFKLRKAGPAKL
jgi:hypothetical protein